MMYLSRLLTVVTLLLVSTTSLAIPLTNGDFSSGLAGWSDASSSGSVSLMGDAAHLTTGNGTNPFSAILVQGDDGTFTFSNPIELAGDAHFLNFDVTFDDLGIDLTEPGGSTFTDGLSVAVRDELDFSGLSDLIFPVIDISILDYRASFDISPLAGRTVAISFELSDDNDGRHSSASIDNITITAQPDVVVSIPNASTLSLALLGLVQLVFFRKIKKISFTR